MKNEKQNYAAPKVEVVEFVTENGFAGSAKGEEAEWGGDF